MKCQVCKNTAVINLRSQNRGLCERCFDTYILDRVEKTIKRFKMFKRGDSLLVAVSGGKDSLALWDILFRLGYDPKGLFIDVGIEKYSYSKISLEKTKAFSQHRNLSLYVTSLREWWGVGIEEIKRGVLCPTCGMAKRYIMNKWAVEKGFSVLCTGHNLDDESAVLLSNTLNWQTGFLSRQAPVLESWHPKLAKKAKPLVLITEKELALYAYLRGIDYVERPCPYSKGASSLFYKKIINTIEWRSPGTKIRFYNEFLKKRGVFKKFAEIEKKNLVECRVCGQPTQGVICTFCRIKEGVKYGDNRGEISERDKVYKEQGTFSNKDFFSS